MPSVSAGDPHPPARVVSRLLLAAVVPPWLHKLLAGQWTRRLVALGLVFAGGVAAMLVAHFGGARGRAPRGPQEVRRS